MCAWTTAFRHDLSLRKSRLQFWKPQVRPKMIDTVKRRSRKALGYIVGISKTDPLPIGHHGDTAQRARLPGEIPPIKVTRAATASAAKTATGKRDGAGSRGSFMYMRTATRM